MLHARSVTAIAIIVIAFIAGLAIPLALPVFAAQQRAEDKPGYLTVFRQDV